MDNTDSDLTNNLVFPLWNDKSLEVIDIFFAPCVDIRTTFLSGMGPHILKRSAKNTFEIFPDLSVKIDEVIKKENKYIYKWRAKGSHEGFLMGIPPTGRIIHFSGVVFAEMEEELVTLYHSFSNIPLVLQEIYEQEKRRIEKANIIIQRKIEQAGFDIFEEISKLLSFPLTLREFECLKQWMKGCSIKETARRMGGLSERTIQTYRESIKKKFGVCSYHQILRIIQTRGLWTYLF